MKKHNIKSTDDEADEKLRKNIRQEVIDMLRKCGEYKKPKVEYLFSDVYDKLTPNLLEQKQEL